MVLSGWVIDRVQAALPEEERLRREQLNDCFTNVSQEQFEAVVGQIAQSGLTLMPESPTEHWQRMVRESSSKK